MSHLNEYDIGDTIRSSGAFTDVNAAAADPTGVTMSWRIADGTVTTYIYGTDAELVKDSTGNYHVDLAAAAAGVYYVRWVGTGMVAAAAEDSFIVKKSRVV